MIGPDDVKRWADSLFADFLRSLIAGNAFFPQRRDRLGRVLANADAERFLAEAAPLWNGSKDVIGRGYKVILERKNRLTRGAQNEPVAVEIQNREDFLDLVGKRNDAEAFERDTQEILIAFPEATNLILADPELVVSNGGAWTGILSVVRRLCDVPRPGCFVRALDVPVPTKFIEGHRAAIEGLLALLPASNYVPTGETFAARCGFAEDSPPIRGRFLCPELQAACGFAASDVELRVDAWASLKPPADAKIVICENKANFLSLPMLPRTLAFWGQGGSVSGNLSKLAWLAAFRVIYWGDMDPSGFAILAQLRSKLPHVESVLMDLATLTTNSDQIGEAKPAQGAVQISFLTTEETEAFAQISSPPRGLEQEKLLFRDGLMAVRSKLF
ncbi:MAG: Wadjet anti-phage system protein JetD domain-containing protein [Opitutus sp.]